MHKTITIAEFPELTVAHALVQKFPNALIAGGCPRDILLGREFRDIDIFVSGYCFGSTPAQNAFLIGAAVVELDITLANSYSYTYDNVIGRWSNESLDILLVPWNDSDPETLVQGFDVGVCEAWMLPTEDGFEVFSSAVFDEHVSHKILGYIDESNNSERIKRLREKFPDWLAVPIDRSALRTGSDGFVDNIPF